MPPRNNPFGYRMRPSRRRFLQYSLAALSGVALSNCQRTTTTSEAPADAPTADAPATPATDEPLHIYTWADYRSDAVIARFTERTGIEVIADVYDANEIMLAKLMAGGGDQYSILYPSDYMVQEMIGLELLTELDHSLINGLDNLFDRWKSPPYDENNTYSIPVSWGTTGYIYNNEVLNPGPEDWDYVWDNREALSRRMTLLGDVREMVGAVLKSLGYSYNSTSEQELQEAYEKLVEIKPHVTAFESFGWEDRLIAGDLNLCMTYSILGNALTADNPQLTYIIPSSGSSVWTDTMVIPKTAPNVAAAYEWINFMMEPENSAFAVTDLRFATPNRPAFEALPAELKADEKLFPPEDILAKCEGIMPLGDATALYDDLWTRLGSA